MKHIIALKYATSFTILFLFLFANTSYAQTDTTQVAQPDSIIQQQPQTADVTQEKKEKKKKKNSFKVYVGGNLSSFSLPEDQYETTGDVGFQLGASYKSGGFFYWELGARYNSATYDVKSKSTPSEIDGIFAVNQVDIPITGGINFLSATARLVGLRVFVSAVPAFVIGVNEKETEVTKNDLNSFLFYGSAGVGVDVAFFFLETGYQYGFNDLLKNVGNSNPGQLFVNLGFRF